MNEIFTRLSTREFTEEPVTQKQIDLLLRAGMQAPSAADQRPWEFYVVKNREILNKLSGLSLYAGPLKKADLGIILCTRLDSRVPEYREIDMAIASENILLEAESLGLGAVMLGIAPLKDRMEYVRKTLELPDNLSAFAAVAVGFKAKKREAQNRFDPERIHYID